MQILWLARSEKKKCALIFLDTHQGWWSFTLLLKKVIAMVWCILIKNETVCYISDISYLDSSFFFIIIIDQSWFYLSIFLSVLLSETSIILRTKTFTLVFFSTSINILPYILDDRILQDLKKNNDILLLVC